MLDKKKLLVRICGSEYTLVGRETEEYLQKVAFFIDRKMQEIMRTNHKLSTTMAAVLTAMNIADDFFKADKAQKEHGAELSYKTRELEDLREEVKMLNEDISILKEKNNAMVIELARRDAELHEVRNTMEKSAGSKLYLAK